MTMDNWANSAAVMLDLLGHLGSAPCLSFALLCTSGPFIFLFLKWF